MSSSANLRRKNQLRPKYLPAQSAKVHNFRDKSSKLVTRAFLVSANADGVIWHISDVTLSEQTRVTRVRKVIKEGEQMTACLKSSLKDGWAWSSSSRLSCSVARLINISQHMLFNIHIELVSTIEMEKWLTIVSWPYTWEFFLFQKMQSRWSLLKDLDESIGILIIELLSKEHGQKKMGLCGENSQRGGRGLTQTCSIFFPVFSNSGAYKMAKKR